MKPEEKYNKIHVFYITKFKQKYYKKIKFIFFQACNLRFVTSGIIFPVENPIIILKTRLF